MDARFLNLEYFFRAIYDALRHLTFTGILDYLSNILAIITPYSIMISVLLLVGIVYCLMRIKQLREAEEEQFAQNKEAAAEAKSEMVNKKWQRVLEHIGSANPGDWRLAIMEADIMLDELLEKLGYQGDGIGEKLKSVEKSDFTSIDQAWEAHKVRNQIAHEGSEFQLSEREAKRVVSLFEAVFKEFKFV
ncbi:MAG: hypothetical protein WC250_03960 [Candidatus Paceibacterota bacterium]|jgi:hypothetical protein